MMRALVVAYYFPPKGGAGTQRFAKFCKFLPEHGIVPTVVSVAEDVKSAYAPTDDASLAIGAVTEVVRIATPAPSARQRLQRLLRLQIDDDVWATAAAERALAVARERRAEVVVTTLSPYACYRIGERLQRELGIPWVVDLRDPWALDGWRVHPTSVHAALDLRHMRRALTRADFVIANVPESRREFVALGADPARTVVIPNGFDPEDFAGTAAAARATDGRFHLAHIGTWHGVDVPAGFTRNRLRRVRHRQIAPLGRTGHYLLHAVAAWQRRHGGAGRGLAVDCYGQVDASHRTLIEQLGIGDVVTLHGYVPHRASIAAACAADALFVPLHDVPPQERALVVPGKLYEALASERPVLAALPAGDGADLVRGLDAGEVVPPTDAEAIAGAIDRLVQGRPTGVARTRLLPFTRASLTADLATVLRAAVARERSVAIVDPWQRLRASGPVPA
ncbi:MAG: glycosyltransferase [Planctomycetes bacterium]|nr:glycosyltransferase [Planctomycetota bacterium]